MKPKSFDIYLRKSYLVTGDYAQVVNIVKVILLVIHQVDLLKSLGTHDLMI